jgi:hypothetical protein
MTQQYYTDRLLPGLLTTFEKAKAARGRAILQEDKDPSHGTCSMDNVAAKFKREHGIEKLRHPSQSPDLNPHENI